MTYQVIWSEGAAQELTKLDRSIARRILDHVEGLRTNPRRGLRRLVGVPYYRLRVGDYRVIVELMEDKLLILVLKVGHRRSIYLSPRLSARRLLPPS